MNVDKFEIVVEVVKVILLSALLAFISFDASYPDVLWKSAVNLFKGVAIVFAYFAGRHFADTQKDGWRNYLTLFYLAVIMTVVAWGGEGTHTEGGDPLFGGGETVVDFVPTDVARADHAVTFFLSLFIPAIYGMYKKRNPD